MKKLLMIVILLFSLCSCNSNKNSLYTFSLLDDGTYEISHINKNIDDDKLILPSKFRNKKITSIGEGIFANNKDIKEIYLPDSIINIKDYAFTNSSINKIELSPNLIRIGVSSFAGCNNLNNIVLPKGLQIIDEMAFLGCSSLKFIKFNEQLKTIGDYAFSDSGIENYELSNGIEKFGSYIFSSTPITSFSFNNNYDFIPEGFISNTKIYNLVLPSQIKSIGNNAFSNCYELENITLNQGLESIGDNAFESTKIELLDIPNSVKRIGKNFISKTNISNIELRDFEDVANSPFDDHSLIDACKVYNGEYYLGNKLNPYLYHVDSTYLIENGYIKDSNKYINIHQDTKYISLPKEIYGKCVLGFNVDSNNKYYSSKDGALYNKDFTELLWAPKNGISGSLSIEDSVEVIKNHSLKWCEVDFLNLPKNLEVIEDFAFEMTKVNENINLENNSHFKVIDGSLFSLDNKVVYKFLNKTSISLLDNAEIIKPYAFSFVDKEKLILTYVKEIEDYGFWCSNIIYLDFPNCKKIGNNAFMGMKELKTIKIESAIEIGESPFAYCKIDEIVFSDNMKIFPTYLLSELIVEKINIPKSLVLIEKEAFYHTTYNGELVLNSNIKLEHSSFYISTIDKIDISLNISNIYDPFVITDFKEIKISNLEFDYCPSYLLDNNHYSTIIYLEKVTRINDFAFYGSVINDTKIIIGKEVNSIGNSAFSYRKVNDYGPGEIYFESDKLPEDLHDNWNPDNIKYYLKDEWEYIDGIPTPKI